MKRIKKSELDALRQIHEHRLTNTPLNEATKKAFDALLEAGLVVEEGQLKILKLTQAGVEELLK